MNQAIPQVQTTDRNQNQAQQNIINSLTLIQKNPLNAGKILSNIALASGDNTIVHGLGRTLVGWFIVRFQGAYADVFDNQNTNPSPQSTLLLNASGAVTVNIFVF